MGFIQHIPQAMLQSLGFMALEFLLFELVQLWNKPSSNQKYGIAVFLYCIAFVHFILELFTTKWLPIPGIDLLISEPNQLQWFGYIGVAYLTILILYFLRFLFQWSKLIQLKSTADFSPNSLWTDWLDEPIQIGFSNQIAGPITFGWLEPVILLPFSILNQLSTEEIKFILLHEIAHIMRRDYLMHMVLSCIQLILCFNPFAYYFIKKIQFEREKAADDWVVAHSKAPILYSKALYQLAKFNYANKHSLSIAASENSSELLSRLQHINRIEPILKSKSFYFFQGILGIAFSMLILFNFNTAIFQKNLDTTIPKGSIQRFVHSSKPISTTTIKAQSTVVIRHLKENSNQTATSIVASALPENISDTTYRNLVQSTIAWIKAREENKVDGAIFTNYLNNTEADEYSVAEQLLLRAVLHNYALKRAILAKKMVEANNEADALFLIQTSKEWNELQQYEKWASRFLQEHPIVGDSVNNKPIF